MPRRSTFQPDAQMLTERTVRASQTKPGDNSLTGYQLPSASASYAQMEDAERADAAYMVRRLANRHDCDGTCENPEHTRDLAAMTEALATLGLTHEAHKRLPKAVA